MKHGTTNRSFLTNHRIPSREVLVFFEATIRSRFCMGGRSESRKEIFRNNERGAEAPRYAYGKTGPVFQKIRSAPCFWGPFSSGMLRLAIFAFLDDKRLRKHLFSSGAIDRCGT